MRSNKVLFRNIDTQILLIYIIMILYGFLNIFAANYDNDIMILFNFKSEPFKQSIWILSSFSLIFFILLLDGKIFASLSYFMYFLSILSLIIVLFIGKEIGGARSWFNISTMLSIQPSEFAKIGTLLALSKYLSQININISKLSVQIFSLTIIFIPILLILLQPDAGSSIIFFSFLLILFREGISKYYLILAGIAFSLLIFSLKSSTKFLIISLIIILIFLLIYMINKKKLKSNLKLLLTVSIILFSYIKTINFVYNDVLKPHQKNRIDLIMGKVVDVHGIGYNLNQSKIAIGSGGLFGKGFLKGTQTKFNFVPEQSTDFIFCTIGEEWGFIGSFFTILIFILFLIKIITMAERQRSTFSRIYGYGIFCIFFSHYFINIGMSIGIVPTIGIPLPFFSYGGSSFWSFSILLFIFIKLDSYRMDILR